MENASKSARPLRGRSIRTTFNLSGYGADVIAALARWMGTSEKEALDQYIQEPIPTWSTGDGDPDDSAIERMERVQSWITRAQVAPNKRRKTRVVTEDVLDEVDVFADAYHVTRDIALDALIRGIVDWFAPSNSQYLEELKNVRKELSERIVRVEETVSQLDRWAPLIRTKTRKLREAAKAVLEDVDGEILHASSCLLPTEEPLSGIRSKTKQVRSGKAPRK